MTNIRYAYISTWASLLPISDTNYFQTMTMLVATSADATHRDDSLFLWNMNNEPLSENPDQDTRYVWHKKVCERKEFDLSDPPPIGLKL